MRNRHIRYLTIIGDIILINLGFFIGYYLRYEIQPLRPITFYDPYGDYLGQQLLLNLLLLVTFTQAKVWKRRRGEFWIDEVSRVTYATAAAIALMGVITFIVLPTPYSRLMLIYVLAAIVIFISIARLLRRIILPMLYRRGVAADKVLVVGSGEAGRGVIRTLLARADLGFEAIGYLDDGLRENNIGLGRIPHLGTSTDLDAILRATPNLYAVFIVLPGEMHQQILDLLRTCQQHGVRAQVVPDLLQLSLNRVEFNNLAGIPLLGVRDVGMQPAQRVTKRVLDLAIVMIGAIPALIVMGIIALAIKLDSAGPAFYTAARIGKDGMPFKMIKFRSMVVGAAAQKESLQAMNEVDGPVFKIRNDPRLTRVGRVIRRLSLDELPQLINVFLGNMSLVGPRPPLPEEVAEYKPWHQQRLSVIGGMTGLWQVSGRSDLTFDELCLLDIYYIENWSLSMDVRILLQTIPHVLFASGAY